MIYTEAQYNVDTIKRLFKLCLAVFLLFYSATATIADEFNCAVKGNITNLPELVVKTQQDIIETAQFGNMNPMLEIAERNEVWPVPDFGPEANYQEPPIRSWVKQSQDTEGRYILAQMIEILSLPYTKKPLTQGVDLYIWPYFALSDLTYPCTEDMINLLKIVTPAEYKTIRETGKYTGYQLAISTDGTWHYFARKNIKASDE
ncbi:MAG: hypothetical protein COB24_00705 [Hyphomicrobiales bacterium]|nr:MAG: hypothetical protein COB24_00705 [Hyphomicrobiales bacterium]